MKYLVLGLMHFDCYQFNFYFEGRIDGISHLIFKSKSHWCSFSSINLKKLENLHWWRLKIINFTNEKKVALIIFENHQSSIREKTSIDDFQKSLNKHKRENSHWWDSNIINGARRLKVMLMRFEYHQLLAWTDWSCIDDIRILSITTNLKK